VTAAACPPVAALAAGVGPSRPVRVAVVGLGKIGVAHTALLSTIPGVEIVGLADRARALARSVRGMGFRAPAYADAGAMLAATRPEAVWVCTPPDAHWPVARACLEAGAAVFVEKPLAHDVADAERIVALAAARGRPAACGYTLAFWPSFAAAGHALAAGAVGRVRAARFAMYLSQVFGARRGWMYERARSGGGVVANVSAHALFLVRAWLGMPRTVAATWQAPAGGVEDAVEARLALADGVEARFESSWTVPDHPVAWAEVGIEGDAGRLAVDNEELVVEASAPAGGWPAGRTVLRAADLPAPAGFLLNNDAYWLEDAGFLAWVTGGTPPPITAGAGLEVQRLMAAIYASAARGGDAVAV
jgi:scyllo-inositol 2-dehydrogenase (NADP+)